MVCGTSSGAGKSFVATGLCRALSRAGYRVAPFKALNMSNHSCVTPDGAEIARAQWAQAQAAGIDAEAAMNPVLLKPGSDLTSHVVVMGEPAGEADASGWGRPAAALFPVVLAALDQLRVRHDIVVVEGAGSAAEINLFDRDIANLALAERSRIPAIVVGDVERGGWFASCVGTVELLPDRWRPLVRGFVANRMHGDPQLLASGFEELERRTDVPVLGVIPYVPGVVLDREDSLDLVTLHERHQARSGDVLDVAVVRFPRLANVADVEPLLAEPGVGARLVTSAKNLGQPDLVILPGTRATVDDLTWLRRVGLAAAIESSDADVLGICGGYQMMGTTIHDEIESRVGSIAGLDWLPVSTEFVAEKVRRWRSGRALDAEVAGFELRHGRTERRGAAAWVELNDGHGDEDEGTVSGDGRIRGTCLHELLATDAFRTRYLAQVAARREVDWVPTSEPFAATRARSYDRLADAIEQALGIERLVDLARSAA